MSLAASRLPDPARPLDTGAATRAFDQIVRGDVADSDIAAFLTALAERGETASEIAAAATVPASELPSDRPTATASPSAPSASAAAITSSGRTGSAMGTGYGGCPGDGPTPGGGHPCRDGWVGS